MTDIKFRSDVDVTLRRHMAGDDVVVDAAKVSTLGADAVDTDVSTGFINFLMANRHGSPFEHAVFTWLISAPIFVWREFMRHRIASYNEESGRYKQLEPVFYIPSDSRNLIQVGKPGHYYFEPGSEYQYILMDESHRDTATRAYHRYEALLQEGIAKEVARMTLPVNIFSSAYVTMNSRALMNFLSLRTKEEGSTFPSFPQHEIEMVARKMEKDFESVMPITYQTWVSNGRVAP